MSGSSQGLTSSADASGSKSVSKSGAESKESSSVADAKLSKAFDNDLNIDEIEIRYDLSPEKETRFDRKLDKALGKMAQKMEKRQAKLQ